MEKNNARADFMGILCNLYLIFLMTVLPLYTKETYYKLGDTKYLLFRNVSLLCVGLWLVFDGIFLLGKKCSTVDICMLCYGACVVVSAIFSSFQDVAWTGYQDWYMGALSQLLFVGIYFLVSRGYDGNPLPVYLGEVALLAVTLLGYWQRLGGNPLGMYNGYSKQDWTYSHMLSTLGNINWLCGFFSVMLAFPIAGYLYSEKPLKKILLYLVSILGLNLLCIQGSDSGPILAVTGMGISLLAAGNRPGRFRKALLMAVGVSVLFPVMGQLIHIFGMQTATPVDGDIYAKMLWSGWWILALLGGVISIVLYRVNEKLQKGIIRGVLAAGMLSACIAACFQLLRWRGMSFDSWGSQRGELWKMAINSFVQGDWKQRLIGAGSDCYAEYLMSVGVSPTTSIEGYWSGAVYANAHNEWLTQLVNLGLLGAGAYFSIFVSSVKRYRGMLLGILAVGMYGLHSLVSFQQVLNTPFLFLVLGLCENRCRKAEITERRE